MAAGHLYPTVQSAASPLGHLFGGRYKAQLIDERATAYLRAACDYVHLNPVRVGLVRPEEKLESYPWSSYPAYQSPKLRSSWLRTDRLLGEHGLVEDTAAARREFERRMVAARAEPEAGEAVELRRGWKLGADDFGDWLADKLSRRGRPGERASERSQTDAALAERLVGQALASLPWREIDLALQPKGHPSKVKIARQLRAETPVTRQWIAKRLMMGSASYVSNLLNSVDSKL